jgi:hypothetical protein
MKTRHSTAIAIVIFALGVIAAGHARAEDRREIEGRTLFAKGEYEKALDIYASLFAEKNDPVYLRNVGRCYQKLKRPDKSIDAFREYLRRAHVRAAEREEINGFIKEMQELQASQTKSPPPVEPVATVAPKPFDALVKPPAPAPVMPPAEVTTPRPAPALTAKPAVLEASAANPPPTTPAGATLVSGPESHPADDGSSSSITSRWWFWTGLGAIVAGGVVAALVLSSGHSATIPPCVNADECSRP